MPNNRIRQEKREAKLAKKQQQESQNSQKQQRNRARQHFVITLRLRKRNIPDITKDQIWDHLEAMPEFSEMILSQEETRLLPHLQALTFMAFLITNKDLLEKDVIEYMQPLLEGEPLSDNFNHRQDIYCVPELKIQGLINKNFDYTVTQMTKLDFNVYYGAGLKRNKNVQSVFDIENFHHK